MTAEQRARRDEDLRYVDDNTPHGQSFDLPSLSGVIVWIVIMAALMTAAALTVYFHR